MTNGDLKANQDDSSSNSNNNTINIELFLTPTQKLNFSQYEEIVDNKSLTNMMLYPVFQWVARRIPKNIGPNLITAAGLICLFQAWYLTNSYYVSHPVACTWLVIGAMLLFFLINSVGQLLSLLVLDYLAS